MEDNFYCKMTKWHDAVEKYLMTKENIYNTLLKREREQINSHVQYNINFLKTKYFYGFFFTFLFLYMYALNIYSFDLFDAAPMGIQVQIIICLPPGRVYTKTLTMCITSFGILRGNMDSFYVLMFVYFFLKLLKYMFL